MSSKSGTSGSGSPSSLYEVSVRAADGSMVPMSSFRGKVLLIVNVASTCGFTKQYAALQALYDRFKERGLVVIGFPCNQFGGQEPGDDAEIQAFCSMTFGVTFPVMAKIEVNGKNTHPLYVLLKRQARGFLGSQAIKWNFTKFLVDREGRVVRRIGPSTAPDTLTADIEKLLASPAAG